MKKVFVSYDWSFTRKMQAKLPEDFLKVVVYYNHKNKRSAPSELPPKIAILVREMQKNHEFIIGFSLVRGLLTFYFRGNYGAPSRDVLFGTLKKVFLDFTFEWKKREKT